MSFSCSVFLPRCLLNANHKTYMMWKGEKELFAQHLNRRTRTWGTVRKTLLIKDSICSSCSPTLPGSWVLTLSPIQKWVVPSEVIIWGPRDEKSSVFPLFLFSSGSACKSCWHKEMMSLKTKITQISVKVAEPTREFVRVRTNHCCV